MNVDGGDCLVYSVYMHTSPSGKRYIGITKQKPEARWRKGKAYQNNSYFTHAINKYGWENFQHEVLYEVDNLEDAKKLEIELIAKYRSDERNFGYNITKGGDPCNRGLTEEERKLHQRESIKNWEKSHKSWRREWERQYNSTREYKDKKNAYNKTDARRKHRREYMKKWREQNPEKWKEIQTRSKSKLSKSSEERCE